MKYLIKSPFNTEFRYKPHDDYDRFQSIDWRKSDIFLEARDQKECGSCWAFATTGVIEGLRAIKYNIKEYLSPQQLVDCDSKEKGCKGGWPSMALNFIKENGSVLDKNYPYTGQQSLCKDVSSNVFIEQSFKRCEEEECLENDLQYKMLMNGPVAVSIDAYNTLFFNYKEGIYDQPCGEPNHAVILVGFGITNDGIKYWIIRNSWGNDWGMNGYAYIEHDPKNYYSCNLNRYGYQPTLK